MNLILKKYLLYFLMLVYLSGAIGFILKPNLFLIFTPYTLLLTCCVFLIYQPVTEKKYIFSFIIIAVIGFICEVIGVKTGLIFGDYYYGKVLGYQIAAVPIIISLNWALLINASSLVGAYFFKSKIKIAICSASLTTLIDILIEQLAPIFDFWHFKNGIVGLQNYFAWFIISLILSLIFFKNITTGNKKIAFIIIFLQLFFFGFIYLINFF